MLPSPDGHAGICMDCLETAATMLGMIGDDNSGSVARRARATHHQSTHSTVAADESKEARPMPKPQEIKAFLDQYIIGQEQARSICRWLCTTTTSASTSLSTRTVLK